MLRGDCDAAEAKRRSLCAGSVPFLAIPPICTPLCWVDGYGVLPRYQRRIFHGGSRIFHGGSQPDRWNGFRSPQGPIYLYVGRRFFEMSFFWSSRVARRYWPFRIDAALAEVRPNTKGHRPGPGGKGP